MPQKSGTRSVEWSAFQNRLDDVLREPKQIVDEEQGHVLGEAGDPFATETVLDHDDVRRFDISSDTASIQSRDQEEAGSVASGDENVEVPVVEMVPPVSPTAAVLRAAFVGLGEWNLEEVSSHRGAVMHVCPEILMGVFPRCNEISIGGDFVRSTQWRDATRTRVEVVHVAPSHVALQIPERRAHPEREVGSLV